MLLEGHSRSRVADQEDGWAVRAPRPEVYVWYAACRVLCPKAEGAEKEGSSENIRVV